MNKIFLIFGLVCALGLSACCDCAREPIVEQNDALIVPPNFGKLPK
ncbi:MAG: hypothetical protein LBL75_01995 [Rickettsiales bacterium]|jgi:hypothetical protein|nr:hypothetical protein [Rickettsiales bacterium]